MLGSGVEDGGCCQDGSAGLASPTSLLDAIRTGAAPPCFLLALPTKVVVSTLHLPGMVEIVCDPSVTAERGKTPVNHITRIPTNQKMGLAPPPSTKSIIIVIEVPSYIV